ncbi:9922_t:CDS:2, partial [Cetraspora pellucida]
MENYYDYSSDENLEENFSTDQDEPLFVYDYLAAMKVRHWLEEQDSLEILEDDKDNEDSLSEDENMDHKFLNVEKNNLLPCIIIDNLKGEIRCCNLTYNLKSLSQLFETWEIEMTLEENSNTNTLGVCSSHFNFDHSKLHSSHAKQFKDISQSVVKPKNVCSVINIKTFLVELMTVKNMVEIYVEEIFNHHVHYVCTKCFESNSGHIHKRDGKKSRTCVNNELHKDNTNQHMMKLLENPNSDVSSSTDTTSTNTTNCLPSPLLVKTAIRINAFDYYLSTDKKYIKADEYQQHSEALRNFIHNSHKDIEQYRNNLENPNSLNEYYNSFPLALTRLIHFAVAIAIHLYLKKNNKIQDEMDNIKIENTIISRNNNTLKVWYLYYCLAEYWKAHRAGIRTRNLDMQLKNLAAFAPLFPVAGKNNYAMSIAFFLESILHHPQQYELLRHVASVNIIREYYYLAFDEALEQYGIKFIKQNLASGLSDSVLLKQRIAAIQDEHKRMLMLYSEFVSDNVIVSQDQAVKQYTEVLWELVDELTCAFNLTNPKQDNLFKHTQEMNQDGYKRMFTFYKIRLNRLDKLLQE